MRDWASGFLLGIGHACLLLVVGLRFLGGVDWAAWLFRQTYSDSAWSAGESLTSDPNVREVMSWYEYLPGWSHLIVPAALALTTLAVRRARKLPGVLGLPLSIISSGYGVLLAFGLLDGIISFWPLAAGLTIVSVVILAKITR